MRRIGVIGAGSMGMGVVRSLLRHGFEVHVRDIDPERERQARALGATAHPSPAALASAVEACVILVVDATQIEAVLQGDDGALATLGAGRQVLLSSTIAPEDAERFAAAIAATGAVPIDAPVSGGPARAADGSMSMMLAAPPAALAAVGPLLDAISGRRFVVSGRPGDGARAKLVNNLMAGVNLAAAAEALALAERLGLDPGAVLDLASASSGQSWILEDRMRRALAGDLAPRAQTHVLAKDLRLAEAAARTVGAELRLGSRARELFEAACAAGWRDLDDASLLAYHRDRFAVSPDPAGEPWSDRGPGTKPGSKPDSDAESHDS